MADTGFEIAIIGMAGRFPGAADVDAFWRNLRDGVEAVTRFTDEQLRARGVAQSLLQDPNYVKAGIVLADVDRFDAGLFGYTPREAEHLDPQQRLFLECAWQALEHAGYLGEVGEQAMVGVYGGAGANLYLLRHLLPTLGVDAGGDIADLLGLMNGNSSGSLCTRVAYKLNLRGPAVTVQTECSTSLVAVHLGCSALLSHDCDVALAGGVWLNLLQQGGYRYQPGAILSPDGHCRAFDAKADGTLIGSGAGIVVLKRLSDALRDGDTLHAVIKGSAVNNDGTDKVGFTAPSVNGQAEVIRTAQSIAAVPPHSIGYIEAHGTGTRLGDPIELAALTQVFAQEFADRGQRRATCAIGSVKTNIGHLDAAAGVAGLIKTVLALKHRALPPSLNYHTPNPQIDFAAGPFYVNTSARPWPQGATPRRAAVSSFGIGGTNAHVVLEEAPPAPPAVPDDGMHLLRLSARSAAAVAVQSRELADHLERHSEFAMADADYTLRIGRRRFAERAVAVGRDRAEVVRALQERTADQYFSGRVLSRSPGVALLLPGEGAQHLHMGSSLYQSVPLFRDIVDQCCRALLAPLGFDLRAVIYPQACVAPQAAVERLAQATCAQPALFVIEYAMARLWLSWGVRPDALLGHGVGEYVAACLAGVFSADDALLLIAARARLPHNDAAPALAEFAALLRRVQLRAPSIPFVSSLTGHWIKAEEATDADYWVRHLRGIGRCADGIGVLLERPDRLLLEVGPGDTLSRFAKQHPQASGRPILAMQALSDRPELQLARCVAQLWVAGIEIDAAAFKSEQTRRRIPLPTYPFERQSYWIAPPPASAQQTPAAVENRDIADWLYVPTWRRLPASPSMAPPAPAGCTLVLGAATSFTQQLVDHLQALGMNVARGQPGDSFAVIGRQTYALRPEERADHQQVLQLVQAELGPVSQVCHLWSLGCSEAGAHDASFFSLLALAQALDAAGCGDGARKVTITVVTNGVEDVGGLDPLHPAKATLQGACKVIPLEYPNFACRLIDVLEPAAGRVAAQVAAQLQADDAAAVVAIRGAHVWAKTYEPLRLVQPGGSRLRQSGVYLITGGLGGIGLALARHLAGAWQARLVLLSRRHLPPRDQWPRLLGASQTEPALRGQLAALLELEALGGQVLVLQADVTDAAALAVAVATARDRFGAVHGVIHTAGMAGGGMIAQRTPAAVSKVFAPKIAGTQNLLQALADEAPDFILLCSSLSALSGDFGQVDYCAANCALDAIATQAAQRSAGWVLSVNWDAWRAVGMAAAQQHPVDSGMTPGQGVEVFERLLSGPLLPQVIVSTAELERQLARRPGVDLAAHLLTQAPYSKPRQERPPLQTAYLEPAAGLEQDLAELWSGLLGLAPIGANDNLFELGGDSLLALQLLARVRGTYGVELNPAQLLRSPTIAILAQLIELRLIEAIETAAVAG